MITTKRTSLKLIELSDLNFIHELHSIAEIDKFNTLGIPKDIEETRFIITSWVEENKKIPIINYTFLILEKETKDNIGLFGLKLGNEKYKRAEVWYKIHPDYWNKDFATEVLKAVLNFCFEELKLHRIQAGCAVGNVGSIKVLEKAGMILEGRGRQILPLKSGWSDNFEYSILESDKRTN
jgi:[ribosomal protein S5]-alanine N-acetyltransferase